MRASGSQMRTHHVVSALGQFQGTRFLSHVKVFVDKLEGRLVTAQEFDPRWRFSCLPHADGEAHPLK